MENCIDVFSRLIIATITFVVPILINLLSTFSAGEKRRKELASESQEELSKIAAEAVQTNPSTIKDTITKTSKQYEQIEKDTQNELNLLNPLKQFWNIFISLLVSFCALLFSFLIRDNAFSLYNHNLSIFILSACVLSYTISLFFIIRILYTISKTKKIIEENQL